MFWFVVLVGNCNIFFLWGGMKNGWLLSGVSCVIGVRTPEHYVKFGPIALLVANPVRLGIVHSLSRRLLFCLWLLVYGQ